MEPIVVECREDFDPPVARVYVAGVYLGDYALSDYRKISAVLGLPELICPVH